MARRVQVTSRQHLWQAWPVRTAPEGYSHEMHQFCCVAGSFNGWKDPVPLHKPSDTGDWFVSMMAKPGLQQVLEMSHPVEQLKCSWLYLLSMFAYSTSSWLMMAGELHRVRRLFQMVRQGCWLQWTGCLHPYANQNHKLCLQGAYNNQTSVAQNITFHWTTDKPAEEVYITGDFSGWMVGLQPWQSIAVAN